MSSISENAGMTGLDFILKQGIETTKGLSVISRVSAVEGFTLHILSEYKPSVDPSEQSRYQPDWKTSVDSLPVNEFSKQHTHLFNDPDIYKKVTSMIAEHKQDENIISRTESEYMSSLRFRVSDDEGYLCVSFTCPVCISGSGKTAQPSDMLLKGLAPEVVEIIEQCIGESVENYAKHTKPSTSKSSQ